MRRRVREREQASVDEEPLRIDGEPHPVPVVFAILFTGLALIGVAIMALARDGFVFGLVFTAFFGGLAAFFAKECIPPWVEIDDAGLRYRDKLRVRRILWNEVQALGTSIRNEHNPGWMLVRLTPAACEARGSLKPDAMSHFSVPAFEDYPQEQLLEAAKARWRKAGGDGTTFDTMGELLAATRMLRKSAETILEMQRRANPGAAALVDAMDARQQKASAGPLASSRDDDDIYCSIIHVRDQAGLLFFCIIAGGEDLDALCATVRREAQRLVREHRFNPEFGGDLQVSLVPDLTPNTSSLRQHMDALTAEVVSDLARSGVVAPGGRPIRMSWAHGMPKGTAGE